MADTILIETTPKPGTLPKPIPGQYWNATSGEYEKVQGAGGAPRVLLWGSDGSALFSAENPGDVDVIDRAARALGVVSAANLDIAMSALRDALTGSGAAAKTLADLATLLTAVKSTDGIKKITDALPAGPNVIGKVGIDQTSGQNLVQLSGSNTRKRVSATVTIGTGAAHSAGDVVSTDAGVIIQFSTGLVAGQSGIILDSLVTLGQNAVFSAGAGYTLYLFTASPTAQATNAVFDLADADLPGYIGKITINTLVDLGSNCAKTDIGHNLSFTLASADTKLYGKLVCNGGETTVSAKVITINLGIAAL